VNPEPGSPRRVARWRIAAAVVVLTALVGFAALFAPIYFHNMELQRFVAEVARREGAQARPDELLRTWVLEKASQLELPVKADNVQIRRSADGVRIEVRYFVRVSLPGYTVDLHFYPGAGSR
jgi:hypothetical protein